MNKLIAAFAEVNNENAKRVLYTLFLILIIALALLSLIGSIILKTMENQGKLLDREISDPIKKCRLIQDQKHFMKYATKKNKIIFFKQSLKPISIIFVGVAVLIIYYLVTENWSYNPWSMEEGFGSLLFTLDFTTMFQINPGDNTGLLINWPSVSHVPTFNINNWCGYISCTCWLVGGVWYLWNVHSFIGRTFRILKLRKTIYEKTLENFNIDDDTNNSSLENFKQ